MTHLPVYFPILLGLYYRFLALAAFLVHALSNNHIAPVEGRCRGSPTRNRLSFQRRYYLSRRNHLNHVSSKNQNAFFSTSVANIGRVTSVPDASDGAARSPSSAQVVAEYLDCCGCSRSAFPYKTITFMVAGLCVPLNVKV